MISRHRQFHWYPTPRLWSWPRFGASSCAWGHAAHPRLTTEDHIGILGLRYSARRIRNLDGLIREQHIVRISCLSKTWPAPDWVDIYRCSRHFEYVVVIERNFTIPFSGLGIYKRKKESEQESKHTRVYANTHAFTQKRTRSRKHALVFAWTRACFLERVLFFRGRVCVFLTEFFFSWTRAWLLSCSLSFFLL